MPFTNKVRRAAHGLVLGVGGAVLGVLVLTAVYHAYRDHAMLHRLLENDARFLAWAEKTEKRLNALPEAPHAAPSK